MLSRAMVKFKIYVKLIVLIFPLEYGKILNLDVKLYIIIFKLRIFLWWLKP